MEKKKYKNLIYNKKNLNIVKFIKKFSILYSLLFFSKKHLKNNLKYISSDLFFIILLPLLGYGLDKKNVLYNNSFESFFKETLPSINNFTIKKSSNLTWETFNYTEYFKKINWNKLKKINFCDTSLFISFNSNLYNNMYYFGTINNAQIYLNQINKKNIKQNNDKFKKYFISGRQFNKFFKPFYLNKKLLFYNYEFINLCKYKSKINFNKINLNEKNKINKLKNWQNYFYELDYIPLRLNNIFCQNINKNNFTNTLKNDYLFNLKKIKLKNSIKDLKKNSPKPLFENLFYYLNTRELNNKFYYLNNKTFSNITNFEEKNSKPLNCKTIIEKQSKVFNFEISNKKVSANLFNYRFFQYKIYNNIFLITEFLNNKINNFNSNSNNTVNNLNNYFKTDDFDFFISKHYKSEYWQNLIKKDLKHLGNTKKRTFLYNINLYNKNYSLFKNTNKINNLKNWKLNILYNNKQKQETIYFINNLIKTPISLKNRDNLNLIIKKIKKNVSFNKKNKNRLKRNKSNFLLLNNFKTKKIKTKKTKKTSFINYFEQTFFYNLKNSIQLLDNYEFINLFLTKPSDKLLSFILINNNFNNSSLNNSFNKNLKENNLFYLKNKENNIEVNYNFQKNNLASIILIKNKIVETKSDLLKRKMSGFLDPDINKKQFIIFDILKQNIFNNKIIKIKGPRNIIYKQFKNFSNNKSFLSNEKIFIKVNNNYNKKRDIYSKIKNNQLKKNSFFGNSLIDFGLTFSYNKRTNYIPNLSLTYLTKKLNSKTPFYWQYPIKDEWLINNNLYHHMILSSFSNQDTFNSTDLRLEKIKINPHSNSKKNNLEILNFNENSIVPISYKNYFDYNINYDFLNIYYSNFIKNFKNLFYSDLYEMINIKEYSFLTQLSFLLIFLKLINNFKENYEKSFLTAFKIFFKNFEFNALTNLKIEVGKTIKSKKIKFNNLIGGKKSLQDFNQTILLLRNSKNGYQSNLNIKKPNFYFILKKNNILYSNVFINTFNFKNKSIQKTRLKNFFLNSKNNKYKNLFFFINRNQKIIIDSFITNPINFIVFNKKYTQFKKTLKKNKKSFIQTLQNKITIKGFLLVGPPGTGKTLLVKALSGESEVPIVLESGEKLSKSNFRDDTISENAKGALQLKNLFQRAKKLSPCILFLDEIDSVGKNRSDILTDYRKKNLRNFSITNSSYFLSNNKINSNLVNLKVNSKQITKDNSFNLNKFSFLKGNKRIKNNGEIINLLNVKTNYLISNLQLKTIKKYNTKNNNFKKKYSENSTELNNKSLSMLTQLLCELDGLKDRNDLIIIGATNRPKILDPALTRPGRLNKIVYIDLPSKKKRFELLKFYSKNKTNLINWEFFANQTVGLSAAHLASAMNLSLLKTIYNVINIQKKKSILLFKPIQSNFNNKNISTIQTFEDIEYGIHTVKSRNSSFKYKCYELGILVNILIFNNNYYNKLKLLNQINKINFIHLFVFSNLIKNTKKKRLNNLKDKNFNKTNTKTWLTIEKKKLSILKQILRTIFYKKYRKFIRSLYLLNNQECNKSKKYYKKIFYKLNTKNINKTSKKNLYFLKNFYKYINRLFKVNFFSCYILKFSTYINNNPLIFSFNFIYLIKNKNLNYKILNNYVIGNFKCNTILKYKLLWYNYKINTNLYFIINKKFFYKNNKIFSIIKNKCNYFNIYTEKKTFTTKKFFYKYYKINYKKQRITQQLIFNDSIFINRLSYYLGGKILILTSLKKQIKNINFLNIWLIKNKIDLKHKKSLFMKQFINKLITKQDFENHLLILLAGKISEKKLLTNINFKNDSNFEIQELKAIGWLLNIMISKNFFYKPINFKLLQKVLIQDLKNSFKIKTKKLVKNQITSIKIEHKIFIFINKFDKPDLIKKNLVRNLTTKKYNFWTLISYWWEPNLKMTNYNIMHWSIFFKKSKIINLSTLLYKDSLKYYYYYNIINNKSNTKFINLIENYDINKYELKKILLSLNLKQLFKPKLNWNNYLAIDYYILTSNLISNSINKIFNLVDLNSELLDYYIYYILCNERFYDFEFTNFSLNYYDFENYKN